MAILIGTDFNEGARGIGPKKALANILKFGRIEDIPRDGKIEIPAEYSEVRSIFLSPDILDKYSLAWGRVDAEQVRRILCDRHSFSVDRVDAVLSKLASDRGLQSQKSLDSWQ
jgi:flap endonuclease-1